jgi:GntR family transcriptional regulator, vanillate catabolism transcriptional regulator
MQGGTLPNQQTRALIELREMIFRGDLRAGERLAEIPLSEKLGVSRTPVRLALSQLEQEGLVVPFASGGFVVRAFSVAEVDDAIDVRGLLEGMAARILAEKGLTRDLVRHLRECLLALDGILGDQALGYEEFQRYIEMNQRFHALITESAGNLALQRALQVNNRLPFASASAFVSAQAFLPGGRDLLVFAHRQHQHLMQALERGEGARAQRIAEEHAQNAKHNFRLVLQESRVKGDLDIPALALIHNTLVTS